MCVSAMNFQGKTCSQLFFVNFSQSELSHLIGRQSLLQSVGTSLHSEPCSFESLGVGFQNSISAVSPGPRLYQLFTIRYYQRHLPTTHRIKCRFIINRSPAQCSAVCVRSKQRISSHTHISNSFLIVFRCNICQLLQYINQKISQLKSSLVFS